MKLKQASAALAILTLGHTLALGIVTINWASTELIEDIDGNPALDFVAQLIWTPDQIISDINPADPFVPTDGEEVLNTAIVNFNGFAAIEADQTDYPDEFAPDGVVPSGGPGGTTGYVYTRVFNVTDFAETPTFYGDTPTGPTGGPIGGPTASLTQRTDSSDTTRINSHDPGAIVVDQLIIPEPSTMLLALVGASLVVVYRRRVK